MRALVLAFLVGCGTATTTADGGGTDGSVDGSAPLCPSSVPADGSPCTSSAIGLFACEYNGNAMGQCATVAECYADGKWHVALPANTCGVNPSECPASFSALAEGSPCP